MAVTDWKSEKQGSPRMSLLMRLFWAYFLLLIFEGALRKWVIPQLSAPLLLIRDPIALLIIWEAYRTRKWPARWSAITGILTTSMLILCLVQLVAVDTRWFVALYGLRSYLLPFPVAFIMGENIDKRELRKFGQWSLILIIPLVALEIAQYLAPPTSFLNAGSYTGLSQISYASGHVRPSGTFSFVTGPTLFIPMVAAFIFYGFVDDKFAKKWLLWAASFAMILSIPVTGSRGLILSLAAVIVAVVVAAFFGVSQVMASLRVIGAVFLVFLLVSQLPIFSEATNTFYERISTASVSEGGTEGTLISRVARPIIDPVEASFTSRLWVGNGIGIGSLAASKLLTGTAQFLGGEGEYERVLFEFGGPFGLAFLLFRFMLAVVITANAFSRVREHQPLAWFFAPLLFSDLIAGLLEQPTTQGFMVLCIAFTLAALKEPAVSAEVLPVPRTRAYRPNYGMRA